MHNIFVVKIFLQRYLVLCIKKHFFSHGIQEFFRLNGQKSLLTTAYTCDKILLQKYLYFFSKVYKNQSFYTEIMQKFRGFVVVCAKGVRVGSFFYRIFSHLRPRARTCILYIREKADFVRFYTVRLYAAIT